MYKMSYIDFNFDLIGGFPIKIVLGLDCSLFCSDFNSSKVRHKNAALHFPLCTYMKKINNKGK